MTAHQLYYIDGDGKRWNVSKVEMSHVPGFYLATRSDGKRVQFYQGELKVELSDPSIISTKDK